MTMVSLTPDQAKALAKAVQREHELSTDGVWYVYTDVNNPTCFVVETTPPPERFLVNKETGAVLRVAPHVPDGQVEVTEDSD